MNANEAEEALKPPCPDIAQLTESNRQLREALAAAKEALKSCDILSIVPFSTWLVANALARIAECEKETT